MHTVITFSNFIVYFKDEKLKLPIVGQAFAILVRANYWTSHWQSVTYVVVGLVLRQLYRGAVAACRVLF